MMIAKVLWIAAMLAVLHSSPALAECRDPGQIEVPEGFAVTAGELMAQKDVTVEYFVMAAVDATLRSAIVGADAACIEQLLVCTEGRSSESLGAEFRRLVIAVPANRGQPASQVVFNIAFGECFRTFAQGEPT
jgi:hypothetical protein